MNQVVGASAAAAVVSAQRNELEARRLGEEAPRGIGDPQDVTQVTGFGVCGRHFKRAARLVTALVDYELMDVLHLGGKSESAFPVLGVIVQQARVLVLEHGAAA